jgi:MATE family multidrug resistance protein
MNKLFTSGSVKELWKMSYPMMVNFFSMSAMLFVDRIFLSWYSKEALSASVTSGTLSWAFICSIMTLAAMSEVFVSQFNGAKKYSQIGKPVWQMMWLCLFSFAFFIPIALLIAPIVFPPLTNPLENAYFSFFMYTGPFFCIHAAIAGFFIGRGYPKIIQWMAIASNLINIILDPIFIWGIDGYFPSFGMMGAAYATLIGTLFQAFIVFLFFISKKQNKDFNTRDFSFDKNLFFSCIKVGIPPAIFMLIELIGWTLFYLMMQGISQMHIFIAGICQSILILFFFVGWGLEKGCIALAGNFIGQKKPELLKNVLKSSTIILAVFAAILGLILIVYPDPLINWFLESPLAKSEHDTSTLTISELADAKILVRACLSFIFFYIIIENLRWVLNGLLTAAGDTLFLLLAGSFSLWIFCLIPIYFLVYLPKASIVYAYVIQLVYAILSLGINYIRFAKGAWKEKKIVEEIKPIENIELQSILHADEDNY